MRVSLSGVLILLAAAPAMADVFVFNTPSANISCSVGTGEGPSDIDCSIYELAGPPTTARPAACRGLWGQRFAMRGRGRATSICGEPEGAPSSDNPLPYGQVEDFRDIVCRSMRSGLSCSNADGHGFFLSRARQSVH